MTTPTETAPTRWRVAVDYLTFNWEGRNVTVHEVYEGTIAAIEEQIDYFIGGMDPDCGLEEVLYISRLPLGLLA